VGQVLGFCSWCTREHIDELDGIVDIGLSVLTIFNEASFVHILSFM